MASLELRRLISDPPVLAPRRMPRPVLDQLRSSHEQSAGEDDMRRQWQQCSTVDAPYRRTGLRPRTAHDTTLSSVTGNGHWRWQGTSAAGQLRHSCTWNQSALPNYRPRHRHDEAHLGGEAHRRLVLVEPEFASRHCANPRRVDRGYFRRCAWAGRGGEHRLARRPSNVISL